MDNENEPDVVSVQLNPAILENTRQRLYLSLETVLSNVLYHFFARMYLKAAEDAAAQPDQLNKFNVLIDRLDKIPHWGEKIIEATVTSLRNWAETEYKFFNLKKILKKLLSTQLCQSAAMSGKACNSRIQLNQEHVDEFLFCLLKLAAPHISNMPQLLAPDRGESYLRREEGLMLILNRAIKQSLSIFVETFMYRIEEGSVDNPFVDLPKEAVHGDSKEAVAFKEVGEPGAGSGGESMVGRLIEAEDGGEEDFAAGMGAAGDEEDGEEGEEEEEEAGTAPSMEFDENPSEDPRQQGKELSSSDNRPWSLDEKKRGTYSDDDMRDDERRNPRRLSFNDSVEVQEFKREAPPSILKRNAPSRIYKTKFDPDV